MIILVFLKIKNIHRNIVNKKNLQEWTNSLTSNEIPCVTALRYPLWREWIWANFRFTQEWFKSNCSILKSFFRLHDTSILSGWTASSSSSSFSNGLKLTRPRGSSFLSPLSLSFPLLLLLRFLLMAIPPPSSDGFSARWIESIFTLYMESRRERAGGGGWSLLLLPPVTNTTSYSYSPFPFPASFFLARGGDWCFCVCVVRWLLPRSWIRSSSVAVAVFGDVYAREGGGGRGRERRGRETPLRSKLGFAYPESADDDDDEERRRRRKRPFLPVWWSACFSPTAWNGEEGRDYDGI